VTLRSFAQPSSIERVCQLLAEDPGSTKVISGGTAVVLMMQQGLLAPESLVSLARVPGLRGVTEADGLVRLGAATTLSEVGDSPIVQRVAPGVATACGLVGNPRIRNVATIGGNLAEADYASDPPAALASVGAVCHVVGPEGTRSVPVDRLIIGFYETVLGHAEVITHVDIPVDVERHRATYLKYRSRSSEDRACVGVAARASFAHGRLTDLDVVVGAVAPTLQRVPEALELALGTALGAEVAGRVAAGYARAIDPMDDARGSAWYRRRMIEVFVRRALMELADQQDTARAAGA
jgi:carbon-monoxide dehydrogenase medium subunit